MEVEREKKEKIKEKTVKPIDSNRKSIVAVEIGDGKCNPYLWLDRWNIMHTLLEHGERKKRLRFLASTFYCRKKKCFHFLWGACVYVCEMIVLVGQRETSVK